jgi:hypothetical protein
VVPGPGTNPGNTPGTPPGTPTVNPPIFVVQVYKTNLNTDGQSTLGGEGTEVRGRIYTLNFLSAFRQDSVAATVSGWRHWVTRARPAFPPEGHRARTGRAASPGDDARRGTVRIALQRRNKSVMNLRTGGYRSISRPEESRSRSSVVHYVDTSKGFRPVCPPEPSRPTSAFCRARPGDILFRSVCQSGPFVSVATSTTEYSTGFCPFGVICDSE